MPKIPPQRRAIFYHELQHLGPLTGINSAQTINQPIFLLHHFKTLSSWLWWQIPLYRHCGSGGTSWVGGVCPGSEGFIRIPRRSSGRFGRSNSITVAVCRCWGGASALLKPRRRSGQRWGIVFLDTLGDIVGHWCTVWTGFPGFLQCYPKIHYPYLYWGSFRNITLHAMKCDCSRLR